MKNIIIAGVPRAGKSTLSNMLSHKFGYGHISMDAIIGGIENAFPELDIKWWPCESDDIKILRIASEKAALIIKSMLETKKHNEFKPGIVIDVVQILPEHFVKYLSDENCDIAYLLTSDVSAQERFAIHKKHDTKKDYTYNFTDEQMAWHCNYVIKRSKLLKEQCTIHGLRHFETARNREKVLEDCICFLSDNAST